MNQRIAWMVLAASGLTGVSLADQGRKSDWLIGTWTLCKDPDHSPKDTLQFNADGTGLLIRAKGNSEFLHEHTSYHVSLIVHAHGYAIPVEYSVSPEHDRLFLYSQFTGHTSYYVRTDSKLIAHCSSK